MELFVVGARFPRLVEHDGQRNFLLYGLSDVPYERDVCGLFSQSGTPLSVMFTSLFTIGARVPGTVT